jgi:hypothetical protein
LLKQWIKLVFVFFFVWRFWFCGSHKKALEDNGFLGLLGFSAPETVRRFHHTTRPTWLYAKLSAVRLWSHADYEKISHPDQSQTKTLPNQTKILIY